MQSVLFGGDPTRAARFEGVLREQGFAVDVRLQGGAAFADRALPDECLVVFVDLALGVGAACALCAALAAAHAPMTPLLAVVGEPAPPDEEALLSAGANLYVADEVGALARRVRFLRGALRGRGEIARTVRRLRESEERYRTVVSALEEGLIVRGRDGAFLTINASAGRILGLTAEEVRARTWDHDAFQFLRADGAPMARDALPTRLALRTGDAFHLRRFGVRRRDGTTVWLSGSAHPIRDPAGGEPTSAVVTFSDRTEQRRIERQLHAVLERGPDAAIVHRAGRVVWASSKWAELLRYPDRDALVGREMIEFVPARFHGVARQRLADRAAGRDVPPLEHALLRADGSEVTVRLVGMPILFEDEPAFVMFARDLTEREQLELQLVAADRLASLGRLAASVGHEINNPLTYVIGNLELALRRARDADPAQGELLEEALAGAERVRKIVRDLRVFSRRQTEDRVMLDLRRVLASCIRMTESEIRHRARLVEHCEDVPPVRGNEARLAQVITNLLLNAAQAIPEERGGDGTITVCVRTAAGGRVEICVEDTGVGIEAEHLPHVFEPFFTTKTARGGTGLGMSICRMLVAAEGGDIELASEVGRGTCVTVSLPAAAATAPPPPPPAPPPSATAPTGTRWRLLLVDDELRIAELLRDNLRPHEVTIATSGRQALALVAEGGAFDAIVCDLMMPELGGVEVYERLRQEHPGLEQRLVFVTGGAFTPRAASFLAEIPNACLEKPFSIPALLAAIEAAAARARLPGPG